jgi:hypothetical protein
MKFSSLYARLILDWPAVISLADAHSPSGGNVQFFPTLAAINAEIESRIDYVNDPWTHIGHWSLFGAFHHESMVRYCTGNRILETRAVSPETISLRLAKNLEAEGWETERLAYKPYPL